MTDRSSSSDQTPCDPYESERPAHPAAPMRDAARRPAFILSPFLVALIYLAYWQIVPRVPASSIGAIAFSTVLSLALGIWLPAQLGYKLRESPKLAAANLAAATLVALPIIGMALLRGRIVFPWSLVVAIPGLPFAVIIWLAGSAGALLSFLVRGANMIPPIAAVLALVDIWTVLLGGPVQRIMESDNPAARTATRVMTVPLAAPSPPRGAAPMQTSGGFADFLFVAFFTAAIGRFSSGRRTYWRTVYGLVAVLSLYMLVVLFTGVNLPALVPMAVAMIALHWRQFHYERSELYALLYAALFIALIAAGFWYLGRQRDAAPSEGPAAFLSVSAASAAA
jgi:hypothetical protein